MRNIRRAERRKALYVLSVSFLLVLVFTESDPLLRS